MLPWGLALVGLAAALLATNLGGAPIVVAWLLVLAALRLVDPLRSATRGQRVIVAFLTIPILVALGVSFLGLYLIPAVVAWLLVELAAPGVAVPRE